MKKIAMPGVDKFRGLKECLWVPSLVWCYSTYLWTTFISSWMTDCMQKIIPFLVAPAIDVVIPNPQLDGNRATKWFTDNRVQVNPEKCQLMMISCDENCSRRLVLNDTRAIVSGDHVSSVCKKASCQINDLARMYSNYDVSARRTINDSFVASNFAFLCGIFAEQQTTKRWVKYKKDAYESFTKIIKTDWELLEMMNTGSLVISRLLLKVAYANRIAQSNSHFFYIFMDVLAQLLTKLTLFEIDIINGIINTLLYRKGHIHPSPKVMADFFQTQNLTWCPYPIYTIFGGCIKCMQVFIFCAKYIDFLH